MQITREYDNRNATPRREVRVTMKRPSDMHVHLRDGAVLEQVAHYSTRYCHIIAMPNLAPIPLLTAEHAYAYRERVLNVYGAHRDCMVWCALKMTRETDPDDMHDAHAVGVIAYKVYPEGVTTNSDGTGITSLKDIPAPIFRAMAAEGLALSVHAERPGVYVLDREQSFLRDIAWVAHQYPGLKVVIEHITTQAAVEFVLNSPENIGATITAHHLVMTLDDVIGGMLAPDRFCKPIAKSPADRTALIEAATSGDPRFFFGSDSAPHDKNAKACGCAGCFTAPHALEMVAEVFEQTKALEKLEDFMSINGPTFYGLPVSDYASISLSRAAVGDEVELADTTPASGDPTWFSIDASTGRCWKVRWDR